MPALFNTPLGVRGFGTTLNALLKKRDAANPPNGSGVPADPTMAKRSPDIYGTPELLTPRPFQPTTLEERQARNAAFTGARQTQEADASYDLINSSDPILRRKRLTGSASYQSLFNSNGNLF